MPSTLKQFSYIFIFLVLLTNCGGEQPQEASWQDLFNGADLEGWDVFIGPDYDTVAHRFNDRPEGLHHDSLHVFSVVKEDNEPAIRVSGQRYGGVSTTEAFSNYHLRLQFKWGSLKWVPKKDEVRDSGLLYHAVGPHGVDAGSWMRSQEFQIEEGNCGDYWGVAGGLLDIPAISKDSAHYVYDPKAPLVTFSETSMAGRHCIKNPDGEKPSGTWNTLDLYCFGDTSVHVVNGLVTMVLFHSRQQDEQGERPLTKGKIQLQSEGAEVFYRHIEVQPIAKIPDEILQSLKSTN